jgi:hypothetical protein
LLSIFLAALEIWARWDCDRQFPGARRPIQVIYPPNPINGFHDPYFKPKKDYGEFRVLCLGESTSKWANYPKFIEWALKGQPSLNRKGLTVKVYSTGFEAHTTLDSYYKYKYLYDGYDFDLVVVYHGINDLRANNCPPDKFNSDYSHFSYYSVLNPVMNMLDIPVLNRSFLALKISLAYQENKRKRTEESDHNAYLPTNDVRRDWVKYGTDIKTADSFRSNIENIVELAKKRGQRILLMTYAYYVPPDYSEQAFLTGNLDYEMSRAEEGVPIEIYGSPENVVKGLDVHDEIVASIAKKYRTDFIDQRSNLKDDNESFIDVCHFSEKGIIRFAGWIGKYYLRKGL